MASRFDRKVAIVTGGASGIGNAIARRLVQEGAHVVIGDQNVPGYEGWTEDSKRNVVFQSTDVGSMASVDALIAKCVRAFGAIDVLVNNAGMGSVGGVAEIDPENWHRVLAVNLNSVFYACRAAIPHMRGRRGAIINIASISGLSGDYRMSAYNTSKAAVINLTRSLALDLARDNIRVNAVCPGLTMTPMVSLIDQVPSLLETWIYSIPMKRGATPEEVAAAGLFLASDEASFITGASLAVDGGQSAHTGQPDLSSFGL
jgi:meso-butanediol dehydrogenase/(S,S)-butanediol dehydrogenase/diacetyl reductase